MRKSLATVLALVSPLVSSAMSPILARGSANLFIGGVNLGDAAWGPVGDQAGVAVNVGFGRRTWPVDIRIGLLVSDDRRCEFGSAGNCGGGVRESATLEELSIGIDKVFKPGKRVRLFVGGGGAILNTHLENRDLGVEDDHGSLGVYANGGIFWSSSSSERVHGQFGFEAKVLSLSDVSVLGDSANADYWALGIFFGPAWE